MGTRASLAVVRGGAMPRPGEYAGAIWLYRHGDGYPSGVAGDIRELRTLVEDGTISARPGEVAGWLVLIGSRHYGRAQHQDVHWREHTHREREEDARAGVVPRGRTGVLCSVWTPEAGFAGDSSWFHVLRVEQRKPAHTDRMEWLAWMAHGSRERYHEETEAEVWAQIVAGQIPPDYREGKRTPEGDARIGWIEDAD